MACGEKVQNENVFYMHCGKRRLPVETQTGEIPTVTKFMGIKPEKGINRSVKKKGSDFSPSNGGSSKQKRSSELALISEIFLYLSQYSFLYNNDFLMV